MTEHLKENLRLRLAALDATWEELAIAAGETPANVRAWVRRGAVRGSTLERLAKVVGVPPHALLDPQFDPREYPYPDGLRKEKDRRPTEDEKNCNELNDGDGEAM